jgi:hypothetical protein
MSLVPFVPTPKFADYQERFKDHFKLERRADGVLLAQAHTLGGSVQLSVENHRALGQLFKTIGADPENELLILTGSGEHFMAWSPRRTNSPRTWFSGAFIPTTAPSLRT